MTGPAVYSNDEFDQLFGDLFQASPTGELDELAQMRLGSARGRASVDAENIQQNIARLTSLMDKVSGAQKERIRGLIANLRKQLPGWTQPKERGDGLVAAASNIARGAATGVATTLPWAADLALVAPDLMGSDLAHRARQSLQESAATTKEFFDPEGGLGLLGELGGGIAGGAPIYGPVAAKTALQLARISPTFARLAAVAGSARPVASRVAGAAASGIAGAPLNLLQATGVDEGQRGTQLAIGTGADLLFGALMPGAQVPRAPGVDAPRTGPAADAKAEIQAREAVISSLKLKADSEAAAKKEVAEARKTAKEAWTRANPDKEWKKVPEKERKELVQKFLEAARATKQAAATPASTPAPVETAAPVEPVVQPRTTEPTPETRAAQMELDRVNRALVLNPLDPALLQEAAQWRSLIHKANAAPPAEIAPVAPAAPVGKSVQAAEAQARTAPLDPVVAEFLQRKGLRERYLMAGIPMDESKPIQVLEDELAAIMSTRRPEVTAEELAQTIATYKGRLAESPHMAPLVAEMEAQLRAMGGTPSSVPVIPPPTPQRTSRVPVPPPDAAQSVVGQPDAMAGQSGVLPEPSPALQPAPALTTPQGTEVPRTPAVTQPSTASTAPSPTTTPAVAVAVRKPKKARVGVTDTDLLNYSSKELSKLDKQTSKKIDKLRETGQRDSQEHADLTALMDRITQEQVKRANLLTVTAGDRPYAGATNKDLLKLREEATAAVNAAGKDPAKAITDNLEAVNREINGRKSQVFQGPEEAAVASIAPKIKSVAPDSLVTVDAKPAPFDVKLLNKSPRSLSPADLEAVIGEYNKRINETTDIDRVRFMQEKMSRYMDELARQQSAPAAGPSGEGPTPNGPKIEATPTVAAFRNRPGFALLWRGGPTQEIIEKLSRSFMWGLGSSGPYKGSIFLRMRWKAEKESPVSNLLPALDRSAPRKSVINQEDLLPTKGTFLQELRKGYLTGYQKGVRGTFGLNQYQQAVGKQSHPAEWNVAKLGAMMGRYIARTERFLTATGRLTYEMDGEPIDITNQTFAELGLPLLPGTGDAPVPLAVIMNMAEGDKTALGNLSVAFASLEGAGRGKMPMDALTAETLIRSAHPKLVRAVQELRKYNLALMVTAHKAGRLSLEGLQAMGKEDWYTPFHQVTKQLDNLRGRSGEYSITQPNPIQGRKGASANPVLNPYDVAVEMTRRVLRANELGMILNSFVDNVDSLPQSVRNEILVPVTSTGNPKAMGINEMAANLRKNSSLSEADAKSMLAYIEGDVTFGGDKNYKDSLIHVWRDGQIQTYKLKRPEIFEALKSLTPTEMDMFWRFMAMPARAASKGVVYNPMFIARMAFIDSFQAFLGSKYGFRPGIDQARGFFHAITRSKEYQKLLDVGGPATIQSLSYIDPAQASTVTRTAGEHALDTAVRNIKELKIVEAYKAIALPFAESARVGEYLRALDHGASTLEAAYAAWDVVGNPRMQGSSGLIRGWHQITMFSRPGMAAVDKLVTEAGIGPVAPEYNKTATGRALEKAGVSARTAAAMTMLSKGFVGITMPSLLIWYLQRDDEDITKLRQTDSGQLFWFIRKNPGGDIIKVRKPHLIGQLFGTSAESWADGEYYAGGERRRSLLQVLDGVMQDATVNTMPQLGVITYGLWANKAPGLSNPIVRQREEQLNPSLMGYEQASIPARIVSEHLEPFASKLQNETLRRAMSPAGLDYIVRNLTGMLGEDVVQGIGAAVEYNRAGFLPTKDEIPIVGRLFARYPGMNVQPIQDFYRRDAKVTEVARTIDYYQQRDPEKLVDYMTENYEFYRMVPRHREVRQMIANYRRAIEDLRLMPDELASREKRLSIEKELLRAIEARAEQMNEEFRETKKVTRQVFPNR